MKIFFTFLIYLVLLKLVYLKNNNCRGLAYRNCSDKCGGLQNVKDCTQQELEYTCQCNTQI